MDELIPLNTYNAYFSSRRQVEISKRKVTWICGENDTSSSVSKKDWSIDAYLPLALWARSFARLD